MRPLLCTAVLLASCTAGRDASFVVHPGAVWMLNTELADTLPIVTAVDVDGYERSEEVLPAEGLRCRRGDEYFEYAHVGVTPGGIHVLDTWYCGGGTGVFRQLLFVRLERDCVIDRLTRHDRTLLRCLGEFALGDRNGALVELRRDRVFVNGQEMLALDR